MTLKQITALIDTYVMETEHYCGRKQCKKVKEVMDDFKTYITILLQSEQEEEEEEEEEK